MSKVDDQFEEFWRQFPRGRKTSKADARRIFKAIVGGKHKDLKASAGVLILGALRYAVAMGENHPYVKKPSTWLNGGCWEDDDLAPPVNLPASSDFPQLLERVSTRERSLYEDLTDRSWVEE